MIGSTKDRFLLEPLRLAKGDDERRPGRDDGTGTAVIARTKPQTKRPNLYRVLLLNDDYTPMEFVVHVLERFFNKQREDATRIMLHVHQNGVGECGIFTYEVAETKVTSAGRTSLSFTFVALSRASTSIRSSASWKKSRRKK